MSPTVLSISSALGWVGATGTVVAYALVSQKVITATSRTFQATNAFAAALLTVSALAHDSLPSAAANVVWVGIAVVALVRSRRTSTSAEAGLAADLTVAPGARSHGGPDAASDAASDAEAVRPAEPALV